MLWNARGSETLLWISAIAWRETSESEQLLRLKVLVFRGFNCLALNAFGKISTCQISSQSRNSLELIQLLISTILPTT